MTYIYNRRQIEYIISFISVYIWKTNMNTLYHLLLSIYGRHYIIYYCLYMEDKHEYIIVVFHCILFSLQANNVSSEK
jgi:hypothetical protein